VAEVEKGGLADRLGLRTGDRLLAINGHDLRDVIDYRFHAADEWLELEIERDGNRLALDVQREYGEDFGLSFTEDVFDGLRRCTNRCEFCFVDQMPVGLRASLYVKDDDYRYSFLHGNFVTLTNWGERDWARVAEQHLSPLYVSVHATDDELRRQLLCNPRAPEILPQLRRLAALGIETHTQIVVIPGLNDGAHLEQTIRDLAGLYPAVQSIGVVPVGLTRYHKGGLRTLTVQEERSVLDSITSLQRETLRRHGSRLVYAADEFYLRTGRGIPEDAAYEGFPQLENGIGLVRRLLDEGQSLREQGIEPVRTGRGTIVCGTLIAPVLGCLLGWIREQTVIDLEPTVVVNEFFGPTVTVSGLLTARDVLGALGGQDVGEVVFLPRSMFDSQGQRTLDGLTVGELERSLGVPVVPAAGLGQLLERFL
jgi:putative radical SAM enzyme (TIGR03279 family)